MLDFAPENVPASTRIAITIAAAWFTWYIWKFILSPAIYHDEPRELPYVIPFVGHMYPMLTNAHGMFSKARKHFQNQPYAMTIMGSSIYVVPSAEGVQAVYRSPASLSFDPVIRAILPKYGITSSTMSKMFEKQPHQAKNWVEELNDGFKLQLHPGAKLEAVQKRLLAFVDKGLRWERLQGRMVRKDGVEEREVSLFDWCEMIIVDAQTRAFFSPVLFSARPDLVRQFQIYEEEGWKLPMDLPAFATRDLRASQRAIEESLRAYIRAGKGERKGEAWVVEKMLDGMDELGMEEDQRVHVLFSFYRV